MKSYLSMMLTRKYKFRWLVVNIKTLSIEPKKIFAMDGVFFYCPDAVFPRGIFHSFKNAR